MKIRKIIIVIIPRKEILSEIHTHLSENEKTLVQTTI